MDEAFKLKIIWNQKEIPVIVRREGKGEKHRVRTPLAERDYNWIKNGRRLSPVWMISNPCWEVPKRWFNDLVERALERYGRIYIIQPYREQEKCSPACQKAKGHQCQCSCMGANHGVGNDGTWFEVSDTFSTRWGDREIACRLLTRRKQN